MSINKFELDSISGDDLQELVEYKVPEGLNIEYKRELYGGKDSEKKELLKDISSFANTSGGNLIIRIKEEKGIAISIDGVSCTDPDAEKMRLQQIIQNGLNPRIIGARIKVVPLSNNNYAFIIRISKSWNPPHRVIYKNSNRFYLRNSGGVHEADVNELRNLFTMADNFYNRIFSFQDQRIGKIINGQIPHNLKSNGRLIVHIVPFLGFEGNYKLDITNINQFKGCFHPIDTSYYENRFNFDGLLFQDSDIGNGYMQLYRNGIIESVIADIIHNNGEVIYRWSQST